MAKKPKQEAGETKARDFEPQKPSSPAAQRGKTMWVYTTIVFAVATVFLLVFNIQSTGMFVNVPYTGATAGDAETVASGVVDYINQNLLSEGTTAKLVNVTPEKGLYRIYLEVGGTPFESYVTTDGSLLFPSAVDLTQSLEVAEEPAQPAAVPKSDRPVVNVFVMSYCPYGLQMEKAIIPVMELLGNKADINIDYVPYIMHGEEEIVQNNYQHCIEKEQKDKFAAYLKCFVQSDDHAKCAEDAGVDEAKLEACVDATDEEYRITELYEDKSTWSGGSFPQYPVDEELANNYGVSGSPTFVLNGKTVSVSRSPEAVKQAICGAFNSPPAECEQQLSSAAEGPGIGALGTGNSNSGGSCG
jgi:protein-disulfide isomerase